MNNNIINNLKGFVKQNVNPKQIAIGMMLENNNNPMINNLMNMANNNNNQGLENFARNLLSQKGRNFDNEFSEFMKQIKG